MSDNDNNQGGDGGSVLPFPAMPHVVLPGSMDDTGDDAQGGRQHSGPAAGGQEEGAGALTAELPTVPGLPVLVPPMELAVPGTPDPGPDYAAVYDATGAEDGALLLPAPADPANPTAREAAALAMALVTALGVAAARGMWQRGQHRQARAAGDKAGGGRGRKTEHGGSGHGGAGRSSRRGGGGDGLSSLLSPAGDRSRRRRKNKDQRRGMGWEDHESGRDAPDRPGGRRDRKGPKTPKTPKSPKDQVAGPEAGDSRDRRRGRNKDGRDKKRGWFGRFRKRRAAKRGPASQARKARPVDGPAVMPRPKTPELESGQRPQPNRRSRRRRVLFWRALRDGQGRRRWSRGERSRRRRERSGTRWAWVRWSTIRTWWFKRWTRRGEHTGEPNTGRTHGWERHHTGFQPPPGFQWMRPPPGPGPEEWTVERIDVVPHRPADPGPGRHRAPAVEFVSLPELEAGDPAGAPPPNQHQEEPTVSMPVPRNGTLPNTVLNNLPNTQYGDADLTIHDVIDADADMAVEIAEGVVEARATADGCERLVTRLEALHAKIVELRVPGVLEGMVLLLMDQALSVKAKAEAIAEQLPGAAEAISVAGMNAEIRHKPLADAVRDAGHTRPAERDYHNE
ncbi:hypothetical protein GT755_38110 [Herbidospora sp. NEAU-GS84]|uniref:Uncharacterized protein n=1 Tax=Herbidospora solisilvae TaxID=2696284 RepID=A0A7C9N684_9ACTN|nr:hypothetical protein [Herbidospora solisilvae]NAS27469.1 hypothetical protein [Herbidospora solisilvae]